MKAIQTDDDVPRKPLSSATPMQLGLVVGFLAVFGSVVWGAATMSAKLDVVINKINSVEMANSAQKQRTDDLEKRFESFKTDFQIHVAQTAPKR